MTVPDLKPELRSESLEVVAAADVHYLTYPDINTIMVVDRLLL